ncbi:MAG: sigma-70 family RNA polymerase sigma factor [Carboxylicivirga sp.]|jgi:RNA polymerase sigma-70 factor (ECF subfamily)|nr:sigma-70 family RNA polymerase sigma factor [Carboxylicivirga sp.]
MLIYDQIYKELFPILIAVARRYVQDDDLCKDIVQDVMMTLWSNFSSFNFHTSIKAYLFAAVKNSAINQLVKKNREKSKIELYGKINDEGNVLSEDFFKKIHKELDNLPNKSREVIMLSMNELTMVEIKDELKVSINTVKTLKRRSYSTLRDKLKNVSY